MTKLQFKRAYGDARRDYRLQATRKRYDHAIEWLIENASWFTVDVLTFRSHVKEYPLQAVTGYR